MLNCYRVRCTINVTGKYKTWFGFCEKEFTHDYGFDFEIIAHGTTELREKILKKFDNLFAEVEETGHLWPWSQTVGCATWEGDYHGVFGINWDFDQSKTIVTADNMRSWSVKKCLAELSIDEIMEIWGADAAKIFCQIQK